MVVFGARARLLPHAATSHRTKARQCADGSRDALCLKWGERVWVSTVLRRDGQSRPAASAVMLAAVTAGVPSAAVRVPSAEIPAAVEALRCMPAASHVEAA